MVGCSDGMTDKVLELTTVGLKECDHIRGEESNDFLRAEVACISKAS